MKKFLVSLVLLLSFAPAANAKGESLRQLMASPIEVKMDENDKIWTLKPILVPSMRIYQTVLATRQFAKELGYAIPEAKEKRLKESEDLLDLTPEGFVDYVLKLTGWTPEQLLGSFKDPTWTEAREKWGLTDDDEKVYKATYVWLSSLRSWMSPVVKDAMAGQGASPTGVEIVKVIDTAPYNKSISNRKKTVDIDFHLVVGSGVTWEILEEQLSTARATYAKYGVQIRLRNARVLRVPTAWLNLPDPREETVQVPDEVIHQVGYYAYTDMKKEKLSDLAANIFTSIITADNKKTNEALHVVTLRTVNFVFQGVTYATSAMSYPSYILADRIPAAIRGVITFSPVTGTAEKPFLTGATASTLAHEMGHKLANVTHEGRLTGPQNETTVGGSRDIMVYGFGLDFPAGEAGRWEAERLKLSPYLYIKAGPFKYWNKPYQLDGRYTDPLYKHYTISFPN